MSIARQGDTINNVRINSSKGRTTGASKSITKVAGKSLKKGKSLRLKAKQVGKSVKKHRALSYESTNTKIATVSMKGVIKAKAKGTCYVYAYAQNGKCKKIKVRVK